MLFSPFASSRGEWRKKPAHLNSCPGLRLLRSLTLGYYLSPLQGFNMDLKNLIYGVGSTFISSIARGSISHLNPVHTGKEFHEERVADFDCCIYDAGTDVLGACLQYSP